MSSNNDRLSKTIMFLRFPLIVAVVFIHTNLADVMINGRLLVFCVDKRSFFYSSPFRFCYSSCKRASSSGSNSQLFKFWLIRMAQKLGPHIVQYFPFYWFPAL